ncbi:glucosaminidase domain-containing protein [Paenibacillus sp. FSL R7-0302]|uniref:glycoside hydrolase family 73 protein n=1 Tax=Paenibacillus sp. FSL R7-0302 TaxID=2921681 RepID=UPI0030F80E90
MSKEREEFFKKYLPDAQRIQARYGIPVSVTLAQSAYESRNGDSGLTTKANNYFGIKAFASWLGDIFTTSTKEERPDGSSYVTVANFRKYGSAAESFDDYGKLISSSKTYSKAMAVKSDPFAMVAEIAKAGYGTDNTYKQDVQGIIKTYNLTQYDKAGIVVDTQALQDALKPMGLGGNKGPATVITDTFGDPSDKSPQDAYDRFGNLNPPATEAQEISKAIGDKVQSIGTGLLRQGSRIVIIIGVAAVLIVAIFMMVKSTAVSTVTGGIVK